MAADAAINPRAFFVPDTKAAKAEEAYTAILAVIKDQLRWPVTPRRLYSLTYRHDKAKRVMTVGELEPLERRYTVFAILEAPSYIIVTRDEHGRPGVTILVNRDEVLDEEEFEAVESQNTEVAA